MISYLWLCLAGCGLGIFTGLVPGIHVNTICILGLSVYGRLGLEPLEFAIAMASMSLTHTFIDYIPAIFLGIPQESTSLSVLPAHRLLLEGKAMDAVWLTAVGSMMGLVFSIILLLPAFWFLPQAYAVIRGHIMPLLLLVSFGLIMRERGNVKKSRALACFLLSGALGVICLSDVPIGKTYILFPVFSGLFGASTMILAGRGKQVMPWQRPYNESRLGYRIVFAGFMGSLGGLTVGLMPALSPSQMGIMMSIPFGGDPGTFLVSVAAINTADAIYSLVALEVIGNPRSGVAVMIGKVLAMERVHVWIFAGVFMISASVSLIAHISIGSAIIRWGPPRERLNDMGILILIVAIFLLTGFWGLVIAAVSCSIGCIPVLSGVSRTHLMGVLMIPTIIYFSNI